MATKMNAETAKRVKVLGINAKDEETAREKLLGILNDNGIEGMEDEDTTTLIEIAESFVEEGSSTTEVPVETESEEAEVEALADEVDAENRANSDEEEETEDEVDEDEDKLISMDRTALKAYIKENDLDVKVKKSWSDDDIRKAIRNAKADEEVEEESHAEEAPAKAVEKKAEKKASKGEGEKKIGKRGLKLDPKNNEDDRKVFDCLHELFPEDKYSYAWVASAGVTIKFKGKNSQRGMVLIENCSRQADDSIKCNLYLLTFTKQTAVLDEAGIEYELCWSGAPFMKGISLDEAMNTITTLMPHITATVQKIDKRLGENRAKMEESLNKKADKKVVTKKTVKK